MDGEDDLHDVPVHDDLAAPGGGDDGSAAGGSAAASSPSSPVIATAPSATSTGPLAAGRPVPGSTDIVITVESPERHGLFAPGERGACKHVSV